MAFRMSEQPRTITIYNLLAGTNEFIGEGDAYIPPHTGLPANSTDIAPPDIPAGFVAVFNSDEASWHLVEDHRGKTVYDVASGDALFISELGPLPEHVTWLSPEGEFQKWNGTAWVKDAEAEKLFRIREAEETKNSLMQVASEHIAPLQDAVDLEIATEEETLLLEAWKKYRVLLNRVDTSTAPDIEWPIIPVTSLSLFICFADMLYTTTCQQFALYYNEYIVMFSGVINCCFITIYLWVLFSAHLNKMHRCKPPYFVCTEPFLKQRQDVYYQSSSFFP